MIEAVTTLCGNSGHNWATSLLDRMYIFLGHT